MAIVSLITGHLPRLSAARWTNHLLLAAMMIVGAVVVRIVSVGVQVSIIDEQSETPIANAAIIGDDINLLTGPSGQLSLPSVLHPRDVIVTAPGYRPTMVGLPPLGEATARLERMMAVIEARDAITGRPISGVQALDSEWLEGEQPGQLIVWPGLGQQLTVGAPNYVPEHTRAVGDRTTVVNLRPIPHGVIVSAVDGQPVPHAVIASIEGERPVPPDGSFQLDSRPEGGTWVLAPGYQRQRIDDAGGQVRLELRPQTVKGLYLTFFAAADESIRSNVERLLAETEANAVVIDVKGDRGFIAYPSSVPLAQAIGANDMVTVPDIQGLLTRLRSLNVYTIARIVVFKDDRLAHFGPSAGLDVAVRDSRTGEVWLDGENLAWVDPFREEAWAYNIALAEEAARHGFDEIQFDYIRFPTDPSATTSVEAARYSQLSTEQSRTRAITEFLGRARAAVHRFGAYLGVDTFGYTPWDQGDMGIGQSLELIAQQVDYVCPMIYPSTFRAGLPGLLGYPAVVADPHRVVYESLVRGIARVQPGGAVVRPWLQYFDDYPWQTRKRYDAPEIRAQIRAAAEAGNLGWMLWDPSNRYSRGGLALENPATQQAADSSAGTSTSR